MSGDLAAPRPGDRILQPRVGPENLPVHDQAGGAEDADAFRLLGFQRESVRDRLRRRDRQNTLRILSDLSQAVGKFRLAARSQSFLKPSALSRDDVILSPAFLHVERSDLVGEHRLFEWIGRWERCRHTEFFGAALDVAATCTQI